MAGVATTRRFIVMTSLCLATLSSALAAEMVSIKASVVNMRSGPSTRAEALWELKKGYPLKVLKRQGPWLQVQDYENDRGWVYRSLTSNTPHFIVKSEHVNIRSGPGTSYGIVAKAERGDLLRTRSKQASWVKVQQLGGKTGWISRKLVWGW